MKKRIYSLIMALTLASVFTGCGSSNDAGSYSKTAMSTADAGAYYGESATADSSYDDYAYEYDYDSYSEMSDEEYSGGTGTRDGNLEEKGEDSAGDDAAGSSAELKRILQEKLVYNYNLSFYVMDEDINDIVDDVEEAVNRYNGFMEYSNQSDKYFSATIRIPTMSRDNFVDAVSEGRDPKGYTLNKSVSNLSSAYTNYMNSYEIAKSDYEAYSAVLSRAVDVDDILKITNYVNQAKGEMDYYMRLMNDIDTDVSYSTIVLDISVKESTFIPEPEDLSFGQKLANSFERGLKDFIDSMQAIAIWFVGNIFGLIIFGIIVVIIVLIIRSIIKKSRAREEQRMERVEAYSKARQDRERMIIESSNIPANTEEQKTDNKTNAHADNKKKNK